MTRTGSKRGARFRRLAAVAVVGMLAGPVVAAAPAAADPVPWHLDAMRVGKAQEVTRGAGVVVAVVDSGVDDTHPDLQGQVLEGKMFGSDGSAREDPEGHGTAMASVIVGKGTGGGSVLGVAPAAKVLPIRLAKPADAGAGYVRDMYDGVRWAIDNGARVVNVSLGATRGLSDTQRADLIGYALAHDVVLVAAAGNSPAKAINELASVPGIVTVSGTRQGDLVWESTSRGDAVVLAAPAVAIPAAVPLAKSGTGHVLTGGTGVSAALVSGAAALIRARYPDLSAGGVVNRLILTARDLGPSGRDPEFGFGLVDAEAALTRDVPHAATYPLDLPAGVEPPRYPDPQPDDTPAPATVTTPADDHTEAAAPAPAGDQSVGIVAVTVFFALVAVLVVPVVLIAIRNSARRRRDASAGG